MSGHPGSAVSLSLPASAFSVAIARQVVSSVGATLELPYDAIDDLRLAVDEGCAYLLKSQSEAETLEIVLRPAPGVVEVTISVPAPTRTWPPSGAEDSLAWYLLSTLSDDARFVRSGERVGIQLTKRADPRS
ncbi:MAG: ATP-binding protein [Actinomycetota bacterium]